MKKLYNFVKSLVISDNENTLNNYKVLLKDKVANLDLEKIDTTDKINLQNYNLIIVDLNNINYIKSLHETLKKFSTIYLVLILPIGRKSLNEIIEDSENYDLILTKPVSTNLLVAKLNDFAEEINENILIKDKNSILIEVLNQNPRMISIFDQNEKIFFANKEFQKFYNVNSDSYGKKNFSSFLPLDVEYTDIILKVNQVENKNLLIEKHINQNWYEFNFFKTKDGYLVSISRDITEIKEKEKKLEESAIFFEHSEEGILITNHRNKIVSVNNAFCRITGYTKDEVIGKDPSILNSGLHDTAFYKNMWSTLKVRNSWNGEIWNRRKNGEIYPQWLSISKVKSESNLNYFIAIFTDLTTLKEADKKIHFYANHDPLTGLLNRVSFEKQLSNCIYSSITSQDKFAVYFIDIDNFKYINDTYGHDIGDEIIVIVGKRIQNMIRQADILSRIGGDEFTLLQKNIKDIDDISVLANKILSSVSKPIVISNKKFNITLSIGISIYPKDAKEKKELLRKADTAMYVVKENGRNGFKLFEEKFTKHIERQFNIQNKLKDAVEKDLIYPVFQPYYDLKTGKIVGCEILARWFDDEEGQISPDSFIKYAENTDLIFDITNKILIKACESMIVIKEKLINQDFIMAVNISGKYFYDKDFIENFTKIINDFNLSPSDFELELTETYLMSKHTHSSVIIDKLKNLGFSIALDDFGTGYSSLNYLKHFNIDKLKIDKSFIDDCHTNKKDLQIVQSIIQFGKILGFKLHAEGVELEIQKSILLDLECDYVQGYFYSKPLSYKNFIGLLNDTK